MSRDEGKLNPGIEYQFEIIAYTAACLSLNLLVSEEVEDFEIYTNQDVPSFDDIIIKFKYKSQGEPFIYMGQIKRYKKHKINFNAGKDKLDNYLDKIMEIRNRRDGKSFLERLLKDVPNENIEFFYFSNSFLSQTTGGSKNTLENPITLDDRTDCYLECDTSYKSIFPLQNSSTCYKLTTKGVHRYTNIFSKFHFFLNQPDYKKIAPRIVALNPNIISISGANDIINYVDAYLKRSKKAKLTKHVFETHLLRLCLTPFLIFPTKAFKINPKLARIWNELVMQFDITITSTEMTSYIFGCLWQEIVHLYKSEFNWNDSITNFKNSTKELDIDNNFPRLSKVKEFRHWLYIPDTITDLLIEMWKCDYLPLVLSSNTNISILNKFKHLKKCFVILDSEDKKEISSLDLPIFADAENIGDIPLRKEFLKNIFISLQGREPVDVYSILNDDIDLMKELKCAHLLYLIRDRKICMKTQILSDSSTIKQIDSDDVTFPDHENVREYKSRKINLYIEKTMENLEMNDQHLIFIEREQSGLKQFPIDADGNEFYLADDTTVPILGRCFKNDEKYINRNLRKATLETRIFDLKQKIICFVTGDTSYFERFVRSRLEIIKGSIDYVASEIEIKLENSQHAIAAIKDDEIQELWPKLASKKYPLLHVKTERNEMLLLKYKNCPNLSPYISYKGPKFNEKSFFEETSVGVTVITGEPGAGKSTLLRSLFNTCDKHSSVLLCDLNDYRQSLLKRNAELFMNPIGFILRKESEQSKYANPHSIYPNYLNFLQMFFDSSREQILLLDSFDEIPSVCQKTVLDFIEVLHKLNIRVVIASRSVMADKLINSFEVEPVKIENLDENDIKAFIDNEKLNDNQFLKYPKEFQDNPMFLNFLVALHHDSSLPSATITKSAIYNSIINRHVERYYSKKAKEYSPEEYESLRKEVLDIHKLLAVVAIFGDKSFKIPDLVYNDLKKKCIDTGKVKLGLISRFIDYGPVFLHRTFAEYLVAELISDNIGQDYVRDIYVQLFDDSMVQSRFFLDDIICENRRLHKAVLAGDLSLVESLCSEGDNHLKEIDQLNRDALHLAATYFPYKKYSLQTQLGILEIIARHMKMKGLDFSNNYDLIRKLNWFHYVKLEHNFFHPSYHCILTVTTQMYFVCTGRIKEGISHFIRTGTLEASIELLRREIGLLPECYDKLLIAVITENRLEELRQLIELKNDGNMKFKILREACKDSSLVSTVSECTKLRIHGGFTALHVACIYGNTDVVKELIKLGVEIDATDDFKREPLFYGIIQGSIEVVKCLTEYVSSVSKEKVKYGFASKLYKKLTPRNTKSRKNVPSKFQENLIYQPYLHISLQENYIEIVKILIENGFDVNERNDRDDTALHLAVNVHEDTDSIVNENGDKIKLLLNYNPNCNVQNYLGETPLHRTIKNVLFNTFCVVKSDCRYKSSNYNIIIKNGFEIIECLLNAGADTNIENEDGFTPLHAALKTIEELKHPYSNHFINVIITLLQAVADVNYKARNGDTALHIAAQIFSGKFVQILLDSGGDANTENEIGDTALAMAAKVSESNTRILLNAGADVNHRNIYGDTALHRATEFRQLDTMKTLLNNGADVDIENEEGETALTIAAVRSDLNTRILLIAGADVNRRNKFGNTALHTAALFDRLDAAKTLLNNGADVDIENEKGDTALFRATKTMNVDSYFRRDNFNVGTLLLKAGADVNHQNKFGETPLHLAARNGRINVVKMLLYHNADKDVVNKRGQTPISVAKHYKKMAVIDILSK